MTTPRGLAPGSRLPRLALAAAAAAVLFACAKKIWNEDNSFVVLDVVSDVKTKHSDDLAWKTAAVSDLLRPNDMLQTFAGSNATIGLKNDQRLFVRELTLLIFGEYAKDDGAARTTGRLELQSGRVQTRSLDASRRTDMAFRTKNAEVLVARSGDAAYDLVIESGEDDRLSVMLGSAAVTAQGRTVSVPENFGTLVRGGEAPSQPRPLPAPPEIIATDGGEFFRADAFEGVPLTWRPSADAKSYHVVVSSEPGFGRVLGDYETASTLAYARGLNPGRAYWRVSTVDSDGLESRPSEAGRFAVVPRVFPDLAEPPAGEPAFTAAARDIGRRHYAGGWARRPDLGDAEIVVYSLVDAWYLQWHPYADAKPRPFLDPDGYWEMRVNGGTRYRAYLVRKGAAGLPDFKAKSEPPAVDGKTVLAVVEFAAP